MRLIDSSLGGLRPIEVRGEALRINPRTGDSDESALFAAGHTGRQNALGRLKEDFGGFDFASLTARYDTNTPALLTVSGNLLADLQFEQVIDGQLMTVDPQTGPFKLVDGVHEPPIPTEVDALHRARPGCPAQVRAFGLVAALQQGTTAIVDNIGHSAGGRLARLESDMARAAAAALQTNAYLSEREASGFGLHWDDHDVIILQAHGRKLWEVHKASALSPVRPLLERTASRGVAWSGILSPGQALYIPRGWGHRVSGFAGEFSLHYTLGLTRLTSLELVDTLVAEALARESDCGGATAARMVSILDQWRDELVERAVAKFRGSLVVRRAHGPMAVIEALSDGFTDVQFDAPFPGGVVFAGSDDVGPDYVGLVANRSGFAVHRSKVGILAHLLEGNGFTLSGIESRFGTTAFSELRDFVLQLARLDLVRIVTLS